MDTSSVTEGILLGIGNPLLDISANVDDALLKKYDLKPDDAIMAEEKHMPLYKELVDKYQAAFIAGGSVQNSLRAAQWLLRRPGACTYFGCVGDDDYAKILEKRATSEGVSVCYQVSAAAPTGTCGVLVTGTHRSLVAHLAAAQRFTPDHLASAQARAAIDRARFFYASGFFVAVSPESILQLAARAQADARPFAFNLSAVFVSQFYKPALAQILPYVDVLFGNETEAAAFAKAFDINETDLQAIALKISAMPKLDAARERVVVLTQGCEPVVLVQGARASLLPVQKLARDQIVDTNGAGDAFTGGYLSQMARGAPPATCVRAGVYAATHVIQHEGCTFSGVSDFQDGCCDCPCECRHPTVSLCTPTLSSPTGASPDHCETRGTYKNQNVHW